MRHTISIIISIFMLVGVIGVPVISSHTHNPEFTVDVKQEVVPICEEVTPCCEADETINDIIANTNCDCSLLASCCCCFLDVRLVSFTFDSPTYSSLLSPFFVRAYETDLGQSQMLYASSRLLLSNLDLPPPKPYSQTLSLFQVFRI